jgi:hypothetical protein
MALIGVAAFSLAIVMDLCVAIARAAGKEIDLQDAGKAKLAAD